MSSASFKNIIKLSITWLVLYVLAVYSVGWALNYGGSHYWATPIWILLYLIPGYFSGYLFHNNWLIAGALVGILGSMFWLLHAQFTSVSFGIVISVVANILTSIFGAWLSQRKVKQINAL